jgi:hypothetical protein
MSFWCSFSPCGIRLAILWGESGEKLLKKACPSLDLGSIVGSGDLCVVELRSDYGGRIYHAAMIIEFREGKIIRETRYYADPFEAPAWRAKWVEPIEAEILFPLLHEDQ